MSPTRFGRAGAVFNALFLLDTYFGRRNVDRVLGPLRRRNDDRLLQAAAAQGTPGRPPAPLAEVGHLAPAEFLAGYARPGRPVVIRGFAADVPAISKWSLPFFADRYGHLEVQSVDGRNRSVGDLDDGTANFTTEQMPWREQIRRMEAGDGDYLAFYGEVFQSDPTLVRDLEPDRVRPYLGRRLLKEPIPKLFLGAEGTSTQWHCAELQNLFVEVSGRKRWLMAAPEYTPCLDPRILNTSQQYCHSMIDFRDPDVERFPLYRYLPTWEVVLEPGDLLYVPPFWWHCVENLTDTTGVALWWPNIGPALRGHATLAWLTVLSPQHLFRLGYERLQGHRAGEATSTGTVFRDHETITT